MSQKLTLRHPALNHPLQLSCKAVEGAWLIRWTGDDHTGSEQPHEQVVHLTPGGPGEGVLNLSGIIMPFYYHLTPETLYLWIQGESYQLDRIQAGPKRQSGGSSANSGATNGEIKSPMPGTVLEVKVKTGQTVEANQPLVIMESMKMEMTLSAPAPGTIESVNCEANTLVEMGTLLVKVKLDTPEGQ